MNSPDAKNTSTVWSKVWQDHGLSDVNIIRKIERERATVRWKRVKAYLEKHRPHDGMLRTLELGAGAGDYSLLLALEGCQVTLVDREVSAEAVAAFQFKCYKQKMHYIIASFNDLRALIKEDYDVVLSIGVVEHLVGTEQENLFKLHADLAGYGGVVFISVPNRYCGPYRLWKWRLERSGRWPYGLEIPMSRHNLFRVAQMLGLGDSTVFGSSFTRSWDEYLLSPITARLNKYLGIDFEQPSWLDQYAGYALVLAGIKGSMA